MGMFLDYLNRQEQEKRASERRAALPKRRMYAQERDAYMKLIMCKSFVEDIMPTFAERFKTAGIAEAMNRVHEALKKCCTKVYYTIPEEQRQMIDNNAENAVVSVGVKTPGSVGWREDQKDYGLFLSYHDIGVMVNASRDHCLTCMGSVQEQEGCELRKVFDRIGTETEHVNGECAYRELI